MSEFTLYVQLDVDGMMARLRGVGSPTPKTWNCPCGRPGCRTQVVYGRASDGRLHFFANVTFQPKPPYPVISIDSARDLDDIAPMAGVLPIDDVVMYATWMAMGLKEALVAEFSA